MEVMCTLYINVYRYFDPSNIIFDNYELRMYNSEQYIKTICELPKNHKLDKILYNDNYFI